MTRQQKKEMLSRWLDEHEEEIKEDVVRFEKIWDEKYGFIFLNSDDIHHDLDLLNRCLAEFRETRTFN